MTCRAVVRPACTSAGAVCTAIRNPSIAGLRSSWVMPAAGLNVYGEIARILPPSSLREWLVAPQKLQGYTIGLESVTELPNHVPLRAQIEFTNLEQVISEEAGDTVSFYTSRAVPAGYTQRGKVIGAAIGPGSSSQTITIDYMPSRWSVGLIGQRIRWATDAYFKQPAGFSFWTHDVSLVGGARASVRLYGVEARVEWMRSQRMAYLFQNLLGGYGPNRRNDYQNTTLRLWISPQSF